MPAEIPQVETYAARKLERCGGQEKLLAPIANAIGRLVIPPVRCALCPAVPDIQIVDIRCRLEDPRVDGADQAYDVVRARLRLEGWFIVEVEEYDGADSAFMGPDVTKGAITWRRGYYYCPDHEVAGHERWGQVSELGPMDNVEDLGAPA